MSDSQKICKLYWTHNRKLCWHKESDWYSMHLPKHTMHCLFWILYHYSH